MTEVYTTQERMQAYIIANLWRIQQIIAPLKTRRDSLLEDEDSLFRDDIKKQYIDRVAGALLTDMCIHLPVDALEALCFIEELNLEEL